MVVVVLHPHPFPSPGECVPLEERVKPGEGSSFEGGGGHSAPRLLEFLPLSATDDWVDGSFPAEMGQGVRPKTFAWCEGPLCQTSEI
jgi:hypothetical protein